MGRLLAVFNIIAGSSSIVGLYITAFTEYRSWVIAVIFVVTAIFVAYVLFVPGNKVETNVSAKLNQYRSPDGAGTITKLHDEFIVGGFAWREIPFPHPFAEPPHVELIKLSGPGSVSHSVSQVTVHKFVVIAHPKAQSSEDARYRWIATGTPLQKAEATSAA
ncbi:hypothetical protein [Rubrivivax sp. A210]|uniref:hypothetical protein n=1 Tax=Rubrivivax sp. A210 TaxID=2772301 RepID=UPI00191AF777|nr:hypothetical protein [Rubrivivax sp. A210]